MADGRPRAEVFEEVYRANYWGSNESRSGIGSENSFAERYRISLAALLKKYGFKSVFDAPCGDLNWMSALIDDTQVGYIGGDISISVITEARRKYPNLELRVFDITEDEFPLVDVWHCRDCLFHLPFADIRCALANFLRSGVPFALLTTHRSRLLHRNLNVDVGGFRLLDLERDPIALPDPLDQISDFRHGRDFPRYVGLWHREQLELALAHWST